MHLDFLASSEMLALFYNSIILGIAFSAPPGVVTAEALRRGLREGFRAALFIGFGSLIGDATWAALALSGAAFLVQGSIARWILGGLGVIFLGYLALTSLRDARAKTMPAAPEGLLAGNFRTGAVIALSNPFNIAFWAGIGGSAVFTSVANPQAVHFVLFFCGFMLGSLIWCFVLASLVGWGKGWLKPRFFSLVNLVCGLFYIYFAVQLVQSLMAG